MTDKQNPIIYGENLICDYTDDSDKSVLLVSHELSLSGAPVVLLNLALTLKKDGWQTLIVSPEDGALGQYAAEHGVPAMCVPDLYESDFVANNRKKYAAVIANTIVTAPVVGKLNGTDMPVIWWIHESIAAYSKDKMQAMPKRLSKNVHVYCVGDYAKRVLGERFPRYKSELLLYYVKDAVGEALDTKEHFKKRKDGQMTFACVGMIEPRKGQDILIEAIKNTSEEVRSNCKFIFVGTVADPTIKEQIEAMQERYPEQILFYEGLGHDELYEIYKEIDFLICSSRDDPMPVVAAEAMSLGRPCLCSANTGTADIIEGYEAGLIYGNNDPIELARLIKKAYGMPAEEYQRLSANARTAFEKEFIEEVFDEKLGTIMMSLRKDSHIKENHRKRAFDIAFASVSLVALSPVLLVLAAAVKLDDRGPVFFKQKRLTKDGKVFEIYKFRSMRGDVEEDWVAFASAEDEEERTTSVGRFLRKYHVDELPQLINVLKGDMSMVGPRPELPELTEKYCEDIPVFRDRLRVKAGLTGYAQVYCKDNDDPGEKIKYDLVYIENMSMLMDLKIMLATIRFIWS